MKNTLKNPAIGARINAQRQRLNMEAVDLAEKLGCSPEHIRRIENGGPISEAHLELAAQALSLSVETLSARGGE